MSLQVWIPLNGSNINQGTYGISTSGSPASWGTGKIGKCATFTGNVGNRITTTASPGIYHRDNFTYAVWLNHNFTGSAAQFAFTVGRADSTSYGYAIQVSSATSINCWFGNRFVNVACKANEWHHIAVSVDTANIKVYVDGVLSATAKIGTIPTYTEAKGLGLGCFHYSGDIYPYYGSMADFRIYNTCLSAREIKEIAKGLCLHYKLGGVDGYFGGRNLVPNSHRLN